MRMRYLILLSLIFCCGCAIAVPIKQTLPLILPTHENAPLISVPNFNDTRPNKSNIGGIGLGKFVVTIDIANEINNRITKGLSEKGFNIDRMLKECYGALSEENIRNLMRENHAQAFLRGDLERFAIIPGPDATFQKTYLDSCVYIKLFDAQGKTIYQKKITASTGQYFGLGTVGPAIELVEHSLDNTVSSLFNDSEFLSALNSLLHGDRVIEVEGVAK